MKKNVKHPFLLPALIAGLALILAWRGYAAGYASSTSAQSSAYYAANGTTLTNSESSDEAPSTSQSSSSAAANWQNANDQLIDGSVVPWQESASGSSFGTVSGGSLHVYGSARATITPTSFSYLDTNGNPHQVNNPFFSSALGTLAKGTGSWTDTVTIASETLPLLAPVDLRLTITMHDSVSAPTNLDGDASAQCTFEVTDRNPTTFSIEGYYYGGLMDDGQSVTYSGDLESGNSIVIHTFVGALLTMDLNAVADADAIAEAQDPDALVVVDLGNTAYFNLDPITSGVSYTTASGFNYVTQPILNISMAGSQLVLSWPTIPTGFALQTNGDLAAANWNDYGGAISTNGAAESITMTPPTGNLFFRLRQ